MSDNYSPWAKLGALQVPACSRQPKPIDNRSVGTAKEKDVGSVLPKVVVAMRPEWELKGW